MHRNDENVEQEINQTPGKRRSFPWKRIGCLGLVLLFFIGLVTMMFWINFIHVIGMGLAGLLIWLLLSILLGRRMTDKRMIPAGIFLLGGLIAFGLLMPVIDFLPCPSWCARHVVKNADYRAMERIFGHSLPASFHITQLDYPGYNLIFNGPDGPLAARYEAVLAKQEYPSLMSGTLMEEAPSRDGDWPAAGYQSYELLRNFGNDWPDKYDQVLYTDKQIKPPRVYRVKPMIGQYQHQSLVTIDDRNSSTVHLYIYTKVPYVKD